MYAQEYKDKWTKVIEPAFPDSPSISAYFLGWGARVNLISPSDENTYAPLRYMELNDKRLVANMEELKSLECKYIFSRIEFSNASEIGIRLIGSYTDSSSPYTIYVYSIN